MDEADILGDRIAIMAEGQLQCCGSSLYLKKTYGVGYQLVIEKQSSNNQKPNGAEGGMAESPEGPDGVLAKIVTGNVDDAVLLNNVGTEMSFQLPMTSSSQFTPMFQGLDEQVEKGIVVSYGVSITTLEGTSCEESHVESCSCISQQHSPSSFLSIFRGVSSCCQRSQCRKAGVCLVYTAGIADDVDRGC